MLMAALIRSGRERLRLGTKKKRRDIRERIPSRNLMQFFGKR
jgi:hypothetical protein